MMAEQMLRAVLDDLKSDGTLMTCSTQVDPAFELGAVLQHFDSNQPILFENVKGYRMPVVGGLYGTRKLMYRFLHTTKEERLYKIMGAIGDPVEPKVVEHAPVQENIIRKNINIRRLLPVPTSNGKDGGPYITSGILVLKDPVNGRTLTAARRFQVRENNMISVLVSGASPYVRSILKDAREAKRNVECAVVLGYDAYYLLASQVGARYGLDKHALDGALRGEPLEVVKATSVDLEVPANAEIVLEGYIPHDKMPEEGPFGELMGYYGVVEPNPCMIVTTVTHRNDPIYQHAFPCREEHLANGMIREAETFSQLKTCVDVKDVNITIGGGCRLHCIISIAKRNEGDGKSAILTALGANKDTKHVVVVDDDVDIYDPMDIEFAIASRVQAGKDVVIVPGALGSALEASHVAQGVTDKMGIDATAPLGEKHELFERAVINGYEKKTDLDIRKYFPDL